MQSSKMAVQLGELLTNAKGGKYIPLRGEGAGPPEWIPDQWFRVLWQPTVFAESEGRRVPRCLDFQDEAKSHVVAVLLVKELSKRSIADPKLFNKCLTARDVEARFQSCFKTSSKGTSFIKLKFNWDKVRFWDLEQNPIDDPGDLAGRECRFRAELRQIWIMNQQCRPALGGY